ncbi:MAG: LysR family transcriptional regulator [Synergistaceae bacterium]|nr:LysR family transcriptional regulator [Synergistaceae bacterium]MBQ3346955.1 LysR family transcriptional regulator [Synergistaceae bacterium]MBQ3399314.1 LysR family transcriptional regulator [Synergistaceae bacterium]MBQ3758377.1 LysR family transcriptional regulator [Synergistaceae bacterium]MBQ4401830.1 LysR family transcriptional regulator [Synergistaceae bacterium]
MDNRFLNYFLEIAKRKNLSKAASYLFLTQSSLSQFLAKEEEELGVKLVIRDKKGLKLTYAGELYKETCEKILDLQSQLYYSLADLKQSKTGITKVGITPQWGGMVFASIMPKFVEKYPLTSLKFFEETAHPLIEAIAANEIDIALIALDCDEPLQYQSFKIHKEELLLAVPKTFIENIDDTQSIINLSELHNFPFIISRERTVIRDITNSMFRLAGFTPKITCEINNHLASLEMTNQNLGITIIPKCYIQDYDNIKYFSIAPHWYWDISIVVRRGYELSQSDQYLASLLREYYRRNE